MAGLTMLLTASPSAATSAAAAVFSDAARTERWSHRRQAYVVVKEKGCY